MQTAFTFGLVGIVIVMFGWVSNELGVTQPINIGFINNVNDPGSNNFLTNLLAPLKWVFDAVSAYFQLSFFQAEGINPLVTTLLFLPMNLILLWVIIRAVRG